MRQPGECKESDLENDGPEEQLWQVNSLYLDRVPNRSNQVYAKIQKQVRLHDSESLPQILNKEKDNKPTPIELLLQYFVAVLIRPAPSLIILVYEGLEASSKQ